MPRPKTTLDLIARELGVTKISVSRALKGQAGVGDELRRRILDKADELGYETQRLRGAPERTRRLAFVTPRRFFLETDAFYQAIYHHLNLLCHAARADLAVFVIEKSDEEEGRLPDRIGDIDGVFLGGELARPFLQALEGLGRPLVMIDHEDPRHPTDSVIIDNFHLGVLATSYLVDRGYQRIGFVGHKRISSNVADRILGYQKVLDREGLPTDESWIVDNYDGRTTTYTLAVPFPSPLPEAFLCHCDRAAAYLIEALRAQGVEVPQDVAVMSFDNTELASMTRPALTCVDIDKAAFAEAAFVLLNERLANPGREPQRLYLPCTIVERDSVPRR